MCCSGSEISHCFNWLVSSHRETTDGLVWRSVSTELCLWGNYAIGYVCFSFLITHLVGAFLEFPVVNITRFKI